MTVGFVLALRGAREEIDTLAAAVDDFAARAELTGPQGFRLMLVLEELVDNAIRHGREDERPGAIRIAVRRRPHAVAVDLRDDGRPFNPFGRPAPDVALPLDQRPVGGLGILLVETLATEKRYRRLDGYNIVDFTIPCD